MKVCDKCRKQMDKGIDCLDFEICDACADKVKKWLKEPVEKGILGGLFK